MWQFSPTMLHARAIRIPGLIEYAEAFALQRRLQEEQIAGLRGACVLTPHAGEFARISDGYDLREYARRRKATVVLKGPVTRISDGEAVYLKYRIVRLVILLAAIVVGVLMWLVLNRTKIGMLVRAGVDDREMLAATGVRIQRIFVLVFAFGAGLAGVAGVVGGTFQSIAPGEDIRFLLASLVVVIVGGMGSIPGAALGAVIIGCAEQFGSVYFPTYAVVLTFLIMVLVLAFRPQGLIASRR